MVCLPLLDVKFNFAVAVGTIGLFKNKFLLVRVRCDRRSRYPAIAWRRVCLQSLSGKTDLLLYKTGPPTNEENLTCKNFQKL
ncbi:hypothetical protein [Microcoleus sp. Pol12B4]|uniref:hypothetical protein n=1 Tax=Microcoleus sp. Pol12B4 TaxID=3055395 RepID=UPI002FD26A8A